MCSSHCNRELHSGHPSTITPSWPFTIRTQKRTTAVNYGWAVQSVVVTYLKSMILPQRIIRFVIVQRETWCGAPMIPQLFTRNALTMWSSVPETALAWVCCQSTKCGRTNLLPFTGLITRKIEKCLHSSELATCLWLEDLQKLICCIRSIDPKTKVQQRAQTFDILTKLAMAEQPDRFVYLQHFPCDAHGKLDKQLLLKECTLLAQPAQDILKSFLHDRLECDESLNKRLAKKQKLEFDNSHNYPCGYELSFRQAGGTSFHAITLCREIGLQMCIDDEQRHLFELLLDENVPLRVVLSFLDTAKLVTHNTKLKAVEPPMGDVTVKSIEPATCSNSSRSCSGLVITRVEQTAVNFQFRWKVNFSKCVDSPVAQYEGRFVAVGSHSKLLRTLDAVTGQELSTLKLPDRIECKVTFITQQMAVVGCYDGCLYGFNPMTGEMQWSVDIGGMIKAQPFLSSDSVRMVICSYAEDYNVMCLSTERQQVLWCIRIGEKAIFATPMEVPRQMAVIICTLDGVYTRVSLLDGTVQWTQKCKQPFFASPVLMDSNTFACAEVNGKVHACNVNSGKIVGSLKNRWNTDI